MNASPKPIVLAMDGHLRCHAYGPFDTEDQAELWKEAQERNRANDHLQFVVIALMAAHIRVSGAIR